MKTEYLKSNQLLQLIPFNREIKPNIGLRKSIQTYGFLGSIVVVKTSIFGTKDGLYILDGQHRYNEAKFLGIDNIPYTIIKLDEQSKIVALMASLNNTANKWTNDHYANCYCAVGDSNYLYLRRIKGETGFSYPVLLNIYTGNTKSTLDFKKGKISINTTNGDEILSYICDIFKIKSLKERSMRAFVLFYRNTKNYNHSKFINNFKHSLPILDDCMETTQFYNKFIEMYKK